MKVKQTVAGLCLAAVVATSVGASAWVPWESSSPKSSVGAWEKYATQQYIVSKFTPNSKNGIAGAYVNDVNVYHYVMVHTEEGHVAYARLRRTSESKDGNGVISKFWSWEKK